MVVLDQFVGDLGHDPVAEILVGGFVRMGEGLGARLIAEGVETEAQRRHLQRLGCRYAQGFLFGHAMPLAPRAENEILRQPITITPGVPLVLPEVAVPPLRKPYWLRCFLVEPAPALLVDPPVSQLKVS